MLNKQQGGNTISTDRAMLNIQTIHDFISTQSYWGIGRSIEVVQKSIDNSLPFGVYCREEYAKGCLLFSWGETFQNFKSIPNSKAP